MRYLIMAIALLFGVGGCQFINPIGPIIQLGVFWMEGEAHKYYNADQATVHRAVKDSLSELGLPLIREEVKGGTIHIRAGDDDRFKIKIVSVKPKVTKLSIRVNVFGDRPFAELIYRHVDRKPGVQDFATVEQLNTAVR